MKKTINSILACGILAGCGLSLLGSGVKAGAAPAAVRVPLAGDAPAAVSAGRILGRLPATTTIAGTMVFALRNPAELDALLQRLHDPHDPQQGRYLTPQEFTARFGPTAAQYAEAAQYAKAQGLTITGTHANRLLLDVSGPSSRMEAAFGVHLNSYQSASGRVFHSPDAAPSVPRALAGVLTGVAGLSDAALRRPHNVRLSAALRPEVQGQRTAGTGPSGGLAPSDIKTAYGLGGSALTGSGQTLAVFELDGYQAPDIAQYEAYFGLPSVPLQNVLLDGATGTAGDNSDEVTLDIELQIALAPGASKMLVYETGPSDQNVLDGYSRIAEDDQAKQISTSWGSDEQETASSTIQAESTIFKQMAAQGQTIFAAAGDSGAYDSGVRRDGLRVDDPGSQPYMCSVGGTTLTTSGAGGAYLSETAWNAGSVQNGAGGGGISSVWPIPSWQQAAVTSASRGSATMRNVPDVSLDADPNTGYSIFWEGAWNVYGGTSCAAPLWSGFTALVNQQRAANGLAPLGQASPALYPLLNAARYDSDFHDIADGSTNLYYPAVAGYDDATGLGTFSGANLIAALAGSPVAAAPQPATHVLWNNTGGAASLWNYSAASGSYTQSSYGPYSGWTAKTVADGGTDGLTRVLWDNTGGAASIWSLSNSAGTFTQYSFGPYSGWTAQALSVAPSNTTHVLWTSAGGAASLWNYDAALGTFTQNT